MSKQPIKKLTSAFFHTRRIQAEIWDYFSSLFKELVRHTHCESLVEWLSQIMFIFSRILPCAEARVRKDKPRNEGYRSIQKKWYTSAKTVVLRPCTHPPPSPRGWCLTYRFPRHLKFSFCTCTDPISAEMLKENIQNLDNSHQVPRKPWFRRCSASFASEIQGCCLIFGSLISRSGSDI